MRVLFLCRRFGTAGEKEQDITGHDRVKSEDERMETYMTKEQFIALGFTEEQATKAAAASAEELKGYIPKARFDELNEGKKQLEKDLKERDTQLKDLGEKAKGNEELTKQISDLQKINKEAAEKNDADMKALKLNTALKLSLAGKVHDPDIVTSLLDKTKIELDDNGNVKAGLDDQLKSLKESKAFLFVEEKREESGFQFKGFKPAEGSDDKNKGGGSGDDKAGKAGAFGKRLAEFNAQSNQDLAKAQNSYFG